VALSGYSSGGGLSWLSSCGWHLVIDGGYFDE
jgi:hypothetical protein